MSQILESTKPMIKKPSIEVQVVYHPEYLKLAEQIRNLKSEQIPDNFTDGEGHRCVMGALAVEVFGINDDYASIGSNLFRFVYSKNKNKHLVYGLWSVLAEWNNRGLTFNQIADKVEGRAYAD